MNARGVGLVLSRVTRVYKGAPSGAPPVVALRDLSLEVDAASVSLITGPSGSGKTTLLGIAGGLEVPTAGRVWLGEAEITGKDERARAEIRRRAVGFVFQDFRLLDVLTVEENVELPLRLRGISRLDARRRSHELLLRLGLASRAKSTPNLLSGGEKQRVAIARAIAGRPRLLLADEPTANLDTKTGRGVIRMILDLAAEDGTTVVIASHDLRMREVTERIVHLVDGRIERDIQSPSRKEAALP